MYLLGKRADEINTEDIIRLVRNEIPETISLDYKREINIGTDKEKKEFLFDVTSMYNTNGGCLIYGIEERKDEKNQNTGIPNTVAGIDLNNFDKISQQIEDIIKGNTEPSIANIILNPIKLETKSLLIIGIPKGLGLPSMVTFNETNKFYRRRNSGKYAVDTYELNQMFMQNQILKDSAEEFRHERINKVLNMKVFPIINTHSSLFIHIIPFSFKSERILDFANVSNMNLTTRMKPMFSSGWDKLFNLDGFATFTKSYENQQIESYDLIIRNGVYEAYTGQLFQRGEDKIMYENEFIPTIMEKISSSLIVLNEFEVEAPFIISISIVNVLGASFKTDRGLSKKFINNEIYLPSILLSSYKNDIRSTLKPIFDIFWQAVGYSSSPSI